MMTDLENWFYSRMVKELKEIAQEHGTNSLAYVIGILEHDLSIEEAED